MAGRSPPAKSRFMDVNVAFERVEPPVPYLREAVATAALYGYHAVSFNRIVDLPLKTRDACIRPTVEVPDAMLSPAQLVQSYGGTTTVMHTAVAPTAAAPEHDEFLGDVLSLPAGAVADPPTALPPRPTADSANTSLHRAAIDALQVYHRITIRAEEGSDRHLDSLNKDNPVLASYDLVGVEVHTMAGWKAALACGAVDLVSLPWTQRLPFPLTKAALDEAAAAGVSVEVTLAPALAHPTLRRFFVANVSELHRQLRGRLGKGGVVLSGGATSTRHIRAPHDTAALVAGLTSIPRTAALACLSLAPAACLQAAAARRATRGVSVEVGPAAATGDARVPTPAAHGRRVRSEQDVEGLVAAGDAMAAAGAASALGAALDPAGKPLGRRKRRREEKKQAARTAKATAALGALASHTPGGGAAAVVGGGAATLGSAAKAARRR